MSRHQTFLDLHSAPGGFVMPNAWDAGSARILEEAGFPAIATTSNGVAFSLARPDYAVADQRLAVTREAMLARAAEIAAAVSLPVNADLEAGYGDAPETVAETVRLAIEAGLSGANIEDRPAQGGPLYPTTLAAERLAAAREAIDAAGRPFVLTGRCDALAVGLTAEEAIARSNRYLAAGAHCAFAPGAADLPTIRELVEGIEGPLNMVLGLGTLEGDAATWRAAGVQRISLGGTLARASLGFLRRAAQELAETGTLGFAEVQIPAAELNALFSRPA